MNRLFTILSLAAIWSVGANAQQPKPLFPAEPREIAPDVWFQQVNGSSNCSWIVFDEYVLVIDANFSWVAKSLEERIKKTTTKPIRYVFDTHYHGDHAEANPWWISRGAEIVCQDACREALEEKGAKQWEEMLAKHPEFKNIPFKAPSTSFSKTRVFEDAHHRAELVTFGWAHTKGDAFVWLPKEKIVFTGDACVNGPFNYLGDASTSSWIEVLNAVEKLPFQTLCPGHGPIGGRDTLDEQRSYFVDLRQAVGDMIKQGKSFAEIERGVNLPRYEKWAGRRPATLNIQKVHEELQNR